MPTARAIGRAFLERSFGRAVRDACDANVVRAPTEEERELALRKKRSLLRQSLKTLGRGSNRLVDVVVGHRRTRERGLELTARQIHAAVHHLPEEAPEPSRVRRLRGVEV